MFVIMVLLLVGHLSPLLFFDALLGLTYDV